MRSRSHCCKRSSQNCNPPPPSHLRPPFPELMLNDTSEVEDCQQCLRTNSLAADPHPTPPPAPGCRLVLLTMCVVCSSQTLARTSWARWTISCTPTTRWSPRPCWSCQRSRSCGRGPPPASPMRPGPLITSPSWLNSPTALRSAACPPCLAPLGHASRYGLHRPVWQDKLLTSLWSSVHQRPHG